MAVLKNFDLHQTDNSVQHFLDDIIVTMEGLQLNATCAKSPEEKRKRRRHRHHSNRERQLVQALSPPSTSFGNSGYTHLNAFSASFRRSSRFERELELVSSPEILQEVRRPSISIPSNRTANSRRSFNQHFLSGEWMNLLAEQQ